MDGGCCDLLDDLRRDGLACCGVLREAVDEDGLVTGVDESFLKLGRATSSQRFRPFGSDACSGHVPEKVVDAHCG